MPDVRFGIDASGAQRGYAELSRIFAGITQGAQAAADAIKAVESARTGGAGGKVSADRQKQIEAETKAIQTETKAITENTKVQADAIATANRVFATKKEELDLRASLYKALQSEEKATVAAARATLTALSTLGGANRALAQRVQWEDRMRKALEAGVITERQLIELRKQAEIQFSTQAVKARDLRTNIAALSTGFKQLVSVLAIHNPALGAAFLAMNRLSAATRNLSGGFALLGPLVSILGTAAIAFGALAVAGDRTNRIPGALKRIWEGMKEIAARASEATGATDRLATALEKFGAALPVFQTLEQRLAGVRKEIEAIQDAANKPGVLERFAKILGARRTGEEIDPEAALRKQAADLEKQIADRNLAIEKRLEASLARTKIMHDLRQAEEARLETLKKVEQATRESAQAEQAQERIVRETTAAFQDQIAALEGQIGALKKSSGELVRFNDQMEASKTVVEAIRKVVAEGMGGEELGRFVAQLSAAAQQVVALKQELRDAAAARDLEGIQFENDLLAQEAEAYRQGAKAVREFAIEAAVLRKQRELLAAGVQDQAVIRQTLIQTARGQILQQQVNAQHQAADATQKIWDQTIINIQESFGDLFTQVFLDGEKKFKSLGDFAKQIFSRLAGELTQALVVAPLGDFIKDIFQPGATPQIQNQQQVNQQATEIVDGIQAQTAATQHQTQQQAGQAQVTVNVLQDQLDVLQQLLEVTRQQKQAGGAAIAGGGIAGGGAFQAPDDLAAVLDQFRFEEMLTSGIGDGLDPLKDAIDQFRFEEIVLGASPELKNAVSQGVITGLKQVGGGFRFAPLLGGAPSGFGVFAPQPGGGLELGPGAGVGGGGGEPVPTDWMSLVSSVGSTLSQAITGGFSSLAFSSFGAQIGGTIGNAITSATGIVGLGGAGGLVGPSLTAIGSQIGGVGFSPLSMLGGLAGSLIGKKLGFTGLPGVAGIALSTGLTALGGAGGGALGTLAGPAIGAALGPTIGAAAGPVGIILGAIIGAIVAEIAGGRGIKARISVATASTAEKLRQQGLESGQDIIRQTPFGFIGVSGAGTTTSFEDSIASVLDLIKNVDKAFAAQLSRAEIEAVKAVGLGTISANEKRTFEKLVGQRIASIISVLGIPAETVRSLELTHGSLQEQLGKAVEILAERKQILQFLEKLRGTFEDITEAEKAFAEIEDMVFAVRESAKFLGIIVEDVETLEALAKGRVIEAFNSQIQDSILAFTNAGVLAWDQLVEAQANRVREATALGADLVKVEKLNLLERQALLRQINDPIQSVIDQIKSQTIGQAPTAALANASNKFAEVAEGLRAQTGIFNTQDLAVAAQTLLSVSQELLGAPAFTGIRDTILATLQEFIVPMSATDQAALEALTAIQENTAAQGDASMASLEALTIQTLGISQQVSDALANVGLGSTAMQTLTTETNTQLGSIQLEIARGNVANEQLLQLVLTENVALHSEMVLLRANLERLLTAP